jgi:hypothetical protein
VASERAAKCDNSVISRVLGWHGVRVTPEQVQEVMTDPVAFELLQSANPARLAYNALDGTPRVVPVGFFWNGRSLVIGTVPGAPKVAALEANPSVALTIDTSPPAWPPNVLLLRGRARVRRVEGVFDEYVQGGKKLTPRAEWEAWEFGVRALYSEMMRIDVTPTWATVHDFERRLPRAVEEFAAKKFGPRPI